MSSIRETMSQEEWLTLVTSQHHPAVLGLMAFLRSRQKTQHELNRVRPVMSDEIRKDIRVGLGREWELEETIAEIQTAWERK